MLVVADVNISRQEVDFLKEIEAVERVVYVRHDLNKRMPDEEIVQYALEHNALIVTRDKGFNYNPKKQWDQEYPSVLLVRHKNGLIKRVGWQVREAMIVYGFSTPHAESVCRAFFAEENSGSRRILVASVVRESDLELSEA